MTYLWFALKLAGGVLAFVGVVLLIALIGLIRQWNKPNGFNG